MTSAQRIRRLGFRKWYERELLQSHANLVLLLLAAIGLLGSAEAYTARLALTDQIQVLGAAAASAAIGILALRRYLYLLKHAEFVANQAVCSSCETYAKWDLLAEHARGEQLCVRCRHCGHQWEIQL
jgi:hypothetical protein